MECNSSRLCLLQIALTSGRKFTLRVQKEMIIQSKRKLSSLQEALALCGRGIIN